MSIKRWGPLATPTAAHAERCDLWACPAPGDVFALLLFRVDPHVPPEG